MRVRTAEIQAWLERTKLTLDAPDLELLSHIEEEVLVRVSSKYDTSTWLTDTTTPNIIRTIISKIYASFHIDREYSENQDEGNDYAAKLMANAEMLILGIIEGTIEIPDESSSSAAGASFYPTDASSAQTATSEDPSLGGPYFSLGRSF